MKTLIKSFSNLSILILVSLSAHANLGTDKTQFHSMGEIPIQGQGGWDAMSVDPDSHHLFVSHFDRVVVIDTEQNKVIKEITGTNGVHGIALALDLKKGYSSNGKDDSVSVIDLSRLEIKSKIKVGKKPDAIVYVPKTNEVYTFNGDGNTVSIIDANTDRVTNTLNLAGKPEFAVVEQSGSQVYVNIEDKNSVAVIDTKAHKVAATWKLDGCENPTGIAVDSINHRIFSVCENAKMVMLDSVNGKTLSSVPTGDGTDGADFDPEFKLILVRMAKVKRPRSCMKIRPINCPSCRR